MSELFLFKLFGNLEQLDKIRLNFSDGGVLFMNFAIAFVMFGVALGIKTQKPLFWALYRSILYFRQ